MTLPKVKNKTYYSRNFFNTNAQNQNKLLKRKQSRKEMYQQLLNEYMKYDYLIQKWQDQHVKFYKSHYETSTIKQIRNEHELRKVKYKRQWEAKKLQLDEILQKIKKQIKFFKEKIENYKMLHWDDSLLNDNDNSLFNKSFNFEKLKYRFEYLFITILTI